jgi:phosphoserine phosphatase RsbX
VAWIDWHACERALPGEAVSGDHYAAVETSSGMLLAAVDGLGHGPEAARAARRAREVLLASPEDGLDILFERCHQALRILRGAVMSAAFVRRADGELSWLGVGNVEAVAVRRASGPRPVCESLFLWPGVVGQNIPSLRTSQLRLYPGDTLVFATDGIRTNFVESLSAFEPPPRLAAQLLEKHGKSTDDALVLVARYIGEAE